MLVLVKHLKINQPPLNNKCNEIRKQSEICTGTTKGYNRLKLLFAALTPDFDDNLHLSRNNCQPRYRNLSRKIHRIKYHREYAGEIPAEYYNITTLVIREINGNTVNFELSKGNALVVADAVTSGEIRGGSIDFNYTDGFEGKGHGNILFDGDSIHVFCMEDAHGNGRISLNCATPLTRD